MKYIFDHWSEVESLIRSKEKVYLFSDYDGTLARIAKRPEQAKLQSEARRLLQSLTANPRYKVAIISGRSLEDIRRMVNLQTIYYAGNHGFEVLGPDLRLLHPEASRLKPVISRIIRILQARLSSFEGVIVEDKGMTASIHYRLALKEEVSNIKRIVTNTIKPFDNLKLTKGKKVLEVRPNVKWDKGDAALWLMNVLGGRGLPIYIGDDRTDEDAFAKTDEGLTILVSNRKKPSKAKYYLKNVSDVHRFLSQLLKLEGSNG